MTDFGEALEVSKGEARRVFKDAALETEFRERGYVLVDLLDSASVERLRCEVTALYRGERSGFHSTLMSRDHEYRESVMQRVGPIIEPHLGLLLQGYDAFAASLTVKWSDDESELPPHQDWTMVDEERFRSVAVWCPLVDTDEQNGALRVLPGSQRVLDHLRCSPANPAAIIAEETLLAVEELQLVPARAGQAIIFDNAVLHGSGPNRSGAPRPAITLACKPVEAQLLHHYVADPASTEVERFEVDADFFTKLIIGERPPGATGERIRYRGSHRRRQEILDSCRHTDSEVTDGRPPTLKDPVHERTLVERGYVVVDLLSADEVESLRRRVEELFAGERAGFHASNMIADHDYRRAIYEHALPLVGGSVESIFVDHEPCTAALMLKFPDPESGFLTHQDWTLVDERHFRSVNVWCPLVDANEVNGTLRVLAGSHLALSAVRCSPTYPNGYVPRAWAIPPEDLQPIRVEAGQALIFDHRMVHASGPNASDSPRPAFTVAMKPRSAELLHWYRPEPESAELEVYRVDADFLCDFTIGEAPRYPLVRREIFRPDDVSQATLLQVAERLVNGSAASPYPGSDPPTASSPGGSAHLAGERRGPDLVHVGAALRWARDGLRRMGVRRVRD